MNSLLQVKLDTALKSLEQQQKSTKQGWKVVRSLRAKWATIQAIDDFYENEKRAVRERFEAEDTKLNAVVETVIETGTREEAPVETSSTTEAKLDLTESDKEVKYYKSDKQSAELRNWQQRAANAVFDKLFT